MVNNDKQLTAFLRNIKKWRSQKKSSREPIPDFLLEDALRLGEVHGLSTIGKLAKISTGKLYRLKRERDPGKKLKVSKPLTGSFVEIEVNNSVSSPCTLTTASGLSIKIGKVSDLAAALTQMREAGLC